MACIEWSDPRYLLNVPTMDNTHREFVAYIQRLESAADPDFSALFADFLNHTENHFDAENRLMLDSSFFALEIHQAEHAHVFKMMQRIKKEVDKGNVKLGREYVCNYLPSWFSNHAATMDSALAATLRMKAA
jgi:hemerythrin